MSDSVVPGITSESELEAVASESESSAPEPWGTLEERITAETESRADRVEQLMARAEALFSAESWVHIGPLVRRQLDTPQWGNEAETKNPYHHHEGIFMDRHLGAILQAVEVTAAGQIPVELNKEDYGWLQLLVSQNLELLGRYAFLHDISKPDTLRLTMVAPFAASVGGQRYEATTGAVASALQASVPGPVAAALDKTKVWPMGKTTQVVEYTWEEWQAQLPEALRSDGEPVSPTAMATYLREQRIMQISYYHQGKQRGEGKMHGKVGAERVSDLGLSAEDVPPFILTAIEKHEVAYQFSGIKIGTFQRHLGSLTDEELRFALTASFLDTMGSLGSDGKADLSAVRALFDSAHNFQVIRDAEAIVRANFTGDSKKLESQLTEFRDGTTRIELTAEALGAMLREKSRASVYNLVRLGELLQAQVEAGALTPEQSHVVQQAVTKQKVGELGRALGQAMSVVRPLLVQAEER